MSFSLEHIGIAVKDLEQSKKLFETLFQTPPYKSETVDSEKVTTVFFQTGQAKIELLGATSPESVIQKFIEKKGEGIHHLAFEVDDIERQIERLKSAGFDFVADQPKNGSDNKRICFLHPRSTGVVLTELCQSIL